MVVFLFCFFFISSLHARDSGIHGHTYEIDEPDLLKQIEKRLNTIETSGELESHNKILQERVQKSLSRPPSVEKIHKTTTPRTFYHDPSIEVPYDLKDHNGVVFHKQGTKVNPLSMRSLSKVLLFIDGDDRKQVDWALSQPGNTKIILTSGSPFELMDELGYPIYFDQEGRLTMKLGIQQVPARVEQDGLFLKITETQP